MTMGGKRNGAKSNAVPHGWRTVAWLLAAGAPVLLAVTWYARDGKEEIEVLESWVAGLGVLGPIIFVGAVVLLTFLAMGHVVLQLAVRGLFNWPMPRAP